MTIIAKGLAIAAIVAIAGCGETKPPGSATATPAQQLQQAKIEKAKAATEEDIIQPPDAVWTITCAEVRGYGHVEKSKVFKQRIKASTGMAGFYLIHGEDSSTINYGFYRAISPRERAKMTADEVKDGQRAQADLAKIKSLRNNVNGDAVFPIAGMSPLEPADPAAPPQWDLRNVDRGKPDADPTKAFWSLEIAVYKDSPQRKQAAVDSVKLLREEYHRDDIYFFHGKTSSSVCIGTWPESAVAERAPDRGGSEDRVLVMPQGTLPGMAPTIRGSDGSTIRPVSLKYEPVDPTLIDTMSKFERRSVNGFDIEHTYKGRDGGVITRYDPSLVIVIPRDFSNTMLGNNDREPTGASGPSMLGPGNSTNRGQLRSLDGGGAQ